MSSIKEACKKTLIDFIERNLTPELERKINDNYVITQFAKYKKGYPLRWIVSNLDILLGLIPPLMPRKDCPLSIADQYEHAERYLFLQNIWREDREKGETPIGYSGATGLRPITPEKGEEFLRDYETKHGSVEPR